MAIEFINRAQELTYQRVKEYLESSRFKASIRRWEDAPRFDILHDGATLIEVEVLSWEVNPWNDGDRAIVKAFSHIMVGNLSAAELTQFLLMENRKMRFGAFHLDEAGQVIFAHSILGGEHMDVQELQTCILSVAAIASSYEAILSDRLQRSVAA